MSAKKIADASRPDVLLEQTLAMLAPLVRLLVANGVVYPQFVAALKPAFFRAAHAELSASGRRISDSAISIVSGVHRKDVRALTSEGSLPPRVPDRVLSLASEVMARWVNDPRYIDQDGLPRALPLRNGNATCNDGAGEPSFEQLTQSVSRDFHSRAVLEELSRLGVVDVTADVVRLRVEHSTADRTFIETMAYLAGNVYDHLAAIEGNLSALQSGDRPPFLEHSMVADELGPESIHALHDLARRIVDSALRRVSALATECVERDERQGGDQALRMRFGIYFYSEPESPLMRDSELPIEDPKK